MGMAAAGSMMGGVAAPGQLGAGMGRGAMLGMSPGAMQAGAGAGGLLGGGGLLQMGLGVLCARLSGARPPAPRYLGAHGREQSQGDAGSGRGRTGADSRWHG